jgi:hypothetical protein
VGADAYSWRRDALSTKARVVVLGIMASSPFAGVAWQALHYLEGLRRLGYDVFYVEDTGDWPYDADRETVTDDVTFTVGYLSRQLARWGLSDRWAYRSGASGDVYGLSEAAVAELYRGADALINLTGSTVLRDAQLRVPVRIYLETDPFLPEIEVAQGRRFTIDLLAAHTHHFTFGENLGTPACDVPVDGFAIQPTRQPVVLDWWTAPETRHSAPSSSFTSISSWTQSGKDVEWNGERYLWSKHLEFLKFVDLPRRANRPFEIALASRDAAVIALLTGHGWRVVDAIALSRDVEPYRDYVWGARGEFTVAKDQYVRPNTGWFSDRSACFLAAGRPVITQETGFSRFLPIGRGLFAFRTMDDIVAALDAIATDEEGHSRAAREVAAEYFAAEKVVGSLMARAGL